MSQNTPGTTADTQQILQDLILFAKKAGAEAADSMLVEGTSLSVSWREGKIESLENEESFDIGLRVLMGKKQAIVSSTNHTTKTLQEMAQRAVAMASSAPEDPFCGLADANEIASNISTNIDIADDYNIEAEQLIASAKEAEQAALAVPGASQLESADASASRTTVFLAASNGFAGNYTRTGYGLSAVVIAGEGTQMERDYEYASAVYHKDLTSATAVGRIAAERAIKACNPRKMPSCQCPVVFDPREASDFLGNLAGAISGSSVARQTSFLKDKLGQQIFKSGINVIDDPLRNRGFRSKIFDGEGLPTQKRAFIEDGILTSWILDLRSARQLGLKSTGNASRGTGGLPSPSPTNFYFAPGSQSPEDLIKDIKQGFYITELMGNDVNLITGDYSRAAKGFWIENGQIAFPVSEMTIAGNLKNIFMGITPANDLIFRNGIDSPTLRVDQMTVAGL